MGISSKRSSGRRVQFLLALALLGLVYPLAAASELPSSPQSSNNFHPEALLSEEERLWVETTLERMSLSQMAAQVILSWIPGSYVSVESDEFDRLEALVDRGIGGVWIMGGLPHARAAKLNELQRRADIPLLVFSAMDLGQHLYAPRRDIWILGGGTDLPPPLAFGAIGDASYVYKAARILGEEMRAAGSHISGGPEVNLLTNQDNVLISRSFGEDPELVGRLASAYVRGASEAGVLTSAGFFPGAGHLDVDPHVTLPVLQLHRERLDSADFVPFRQVIQAGVPLIMTSHFAVPALTGSESLPATLSPEVIKTLREDLDYQGLIVTDAFDMGGLTRYFEHLDAVVRAFRAGHDLLLGPATLRAADELTQKVNEGKISRLRLRSSVRRILQAKARLGLHRERAAPLNKIQQVVGHRDHQEFADSAAARSLVLLRDHRRLVPLPDSVRSVLSLTLAREELEIAGSSFDRQLSQDGVSVLSARLHLGSPPTAYQEVEEMAEGVDLVVFSIYLEPKLGVEKAHEELPSQFLALQRSLGERRLPTITVSFGKLTLLEQMQSVETLLLAWSSQSVMQRAAARALRGLVPIQGTLPVSLSSFHKVGEGLTR